MRVLPLPNDPQCHACHEEDDTWRGAVVTRIATELPDARARPSSARPTSRSGT